MAIVKIINNILLFVICFYCLHEARSDVDDDRDLANFLRDKQLNKTGVVIDNIADLTAESRDLLTSLNEPESENFHTYASMKILNKITAKSLVVDLAENEYYRTGNFLVFLRSCWHSDIEKSSDHRALLEVYDVVNDGNERNKVFVGWLSSKHPFIHKYSHSIYDIRLLNCSNVSASTKAKRNR